MPSFFVEVLPSRLPCVPLGSGSALGADFAKPAQFADHAIFDHFVAWYDLAHICPQRLKTAEDSG